MLRVLEERGFPVTELRPLASARSEGLELDYLGRPRTVRRLTEDVVRGHPDRPLLGGRDAVARVRARGRRGRRRRDRQLERVTGWTRRCRWSCPRSTRTTLQGHSGIVANPNCVAAPLVVALKPIADAVGLERVVVASYQSVSGTGQAAVTELIEQTAGLLAGDEPEPAVYPHPIAFNVLPHIGDFDDDGYTGEEQKVADETRKMLGLPGAAGQRDLRPRAGAVRPLAGGARRDGRRADRRRRPQPADGGPRGGARGRARRLRATRCPREAAGRDDVLVGRIREDASHPRGLALWVVSDNLRKGAATNAVQIAESLVTRGWL